MSWDQRLIALKSPAQQFLWDYAHLIAHSNSHAAGFDGTFCRKSFPILKCLSVYKWWRRVDLVESSIIPQAGHYKCWLDEGWVEYLITREPLVLVSYNCKKSCGLSGTEQGNKREVTNKQNDLKRSLDYLTKGYNMSGRFKSLLDDNCWQTGINVGQSSGWASLVPKKKYYFTYGTTTNDI